MTANMLEGIDLSQLNVPPPAPEGKRYHIGVRSDPSAGAPPCWFCTIGGVSFSVSTSSYNEAGDEYKEKGEIIMLTTEQLARIKDDLRHKVVRWGRDRKTGDKLARAEVWDTRLKGFVLHPGDEALAKFLYVEPRSEEAAEPVERDAFKDLEHAIGASETSEAKAMGDPADKATRAAHGKAKKQGFLLSPSASDVTV